MSQPLKPVSSGEGIYSRQAVMDQAVLGSCNVLYLFLTDLHELTRITHKPGGYFLAPEGEECIGNVSNVLFSNGWIAK